MKKVLFLLFFAPFVLFSQNTIGGTKVSVPEAEVDRESEFLMAERERLLNHNDKALDRYKKFTYDNPKIDAGWYGLARTYAALKDLPNALDAIGKAVQLAPDNQWYSVLQADLYEQAGRMADAVTVYEGLVKRFPKTPEFYQQLAYLMRSGSPDSLDLMVATNYAVMAADLAIEGDTGRMVSLRNGSYTTVPISATREGVKRVDVDELYDVAAYRPKVRHVLGKPMFLY